MSAVLLYIFWKLLSGGSELEVISTSGVANHADFTGPWPVVAILKSFKPASSAYRAKVTCWTELCMAKHTSRETTARVAFLFVLAFLIVANRLEEKIR